MAEAGVINIPTPEGQAPIAAPSETQFADLEKAPQANTAVLPDATALNNQMIQAATLRHAWDEADHQKAQQALQNRLSMMNFDTSGAWDVDMPEIQKEIKDYTDQVSKDPALEGEPTADNLQEYAKFQTMKNGILADIDKSKQDKAQSVLQTDYLQKHPNQTWNNPENQGLLNDFNNTNSQNGKSLHDRMWKGFKAPNEYNPLVPQGMLGKVEDSTSVVQHKTGRGNETESLNVTHKDPAALGSQLDAIYNGKMQQDADTYHNQEANMIMQNHQIKLDANGKPVLDANGQPVTNYPLDRQIFVPDFSKPRQLVTLPDGTKTYQLQGEHKSYLQATNKERIAANAVIPYIDAKNISDKTTGNQFAPKITINTGDKPLDTSKVGLLPIAKLGAQIQSNPESIKGATYGDQDGAYKDAVFVPALDGMTFNGKESKDDKTGTEMAVNKLVRLGGKTYVVTDDDKDKDGKIDMSQVVQRGREITNWNQQVIMPYSTKNYTETHGTEQVKLSQYYAQHPELAAEQKQLGIQDIGGSGQVVTNKKQAGGSTQQNVIGSQSDVDKLPSGSHFFTKQPDGTLKEYIKQ